MTTPPPEPSGTPPTDTPPTDTPATGTRPASGSDQNEDRSDRVAVSATEDHAADLPTVDWNRLRDTARTMLDHSYAPYSNVRVGAAALTGDGRIVRGANVENASYGLSLCAECSLVSDLARTGGGRLVAFTVVGGDGTYLAPCGRCRQLLYEFGGRDLLIDLGDRIATLDELLPGAFGPDDLAERATT